MKLNVLERLVVASLLPEVGSFVNLKLVQKAKESLSFSDPEHKDLNFVQNDNGSVSWNTEKDVEVEFELGDVVIGMVADALKALDDNEKLEARHFSLYEKFVENTEK
jgi:hypothetical protein